MCKKRKKRNEQGNKNQTTGRSGNGGTNISLEEKKKRKTQTKQGIVYTQLQRTKHQQRRLKPYKYRMGKEEKG